jgi:RNA methyltransferase, TrmH family
MFQKISKNQLKHFARLNEKKHREEENMFLAEGEKIVDELIHSNWEIVAVIAIDSWISQNEKSLKNIKSQIIFEISESDLSKLSSLKTPNKVVTVVKKANSILKHEQIKNKLSIALDDIQDPGNLGTIIRLADWFGIETIICSENTVDAFNPKVIQATMGAFMRVNVCYVNLKSFFQTLDSETPVYGAFLEGKNVYSESLEKTGVILMGNESKGISADLAKFVTQKITIPSFTLKREKTESLNVSVATAIICSEFRRR